MRVKELLLSLRKSGWVLDRVRGSHHIFLHDDAKRAITVPIHGKDIPDYYAKAILKQAEAALSGCKT